MHLPRFVSHFLLNSEISFDQLYVRRAAYLPINPDSVCRCTCCCNVVCKGAPLPLFPYVHVGAVLNHTLVVLFLSVLLLKTVLQ